MDGTHEQNEYRKNHKANYTLSAKRMSSKEMGGKYKTNRPSGLIFDRKRKKSFCTLGKV
jgi:hypothetical protein